MNKSKRGISLIVLVITIIVIIILAAAVILTINNNNPMDNANKARYTSDRANVQDALTAAIGKIAAEKLCSVTIPAQTNIATGIEYTLTGANDGVIGGKIGWDTLATGAPVGYEKTTMLGMKLPNYGSSSIWQIDSAGNVVLIVGDSIYGTKEYSKDGLVLWLDAENNTGSGHSNTTTAWTDLSGRKDNGVLQNFDFSETSKWNSNSLKFDGVNDVVSLSHQTDFSLYQTGKAFSMGISFKTSQEIKDWEGLMTNVPSKTGSIGDGGFNMQYGIVQNIGAYVPPAQYFKTNTKTKSDTSYNSYLVYDGNIMCLYINGEKVREEAVAISPGGKDMRIGYFYSVGSLHSTIFLQGEIHTILFYDRALTENEVKKNANIDKERFHISDN